MGTTFKVRRNRTKKQAAPNQILPVNFAKGKFRQR